MHNNGNLILKEINVFLIIISIISYIYKYVFNDVPLGESLQARDAIQMPQKSQEGLYVQSPTSLFKYLF